MGREQDDFLADLNIELDDDIEFDIQDDEPGETPDEGEPDEGPKKPATPIVGGEEFIEIDDEGNPTDDDEPEDDLEDDENPSKKGKSGTGKTPAAPSNVDDKGGASSPPSQLYTAFAKKLAEDGVLSDFNEETFNTLLEETGNPAEALVELVRGSVSEAVEEYKTTAEAEYKAFLEAKESNIPVSEFTSITSLISKLEDLTDDVLEEDETQAMFVIKESLLARGIKPVKADKLVKQYQALGTLGEEAIEARDELLDLKKTEVEELKKATKEQEELTKRQIEAQREALKNDIEGTVELIPGITLTKKDKNSIYESIVKPAGYYPNGQPFNAVMAQRSKNPVAFEKMLHYLLNVGIFNLDDKNRPKPDWSKIVKVKQTKVASEFDKILSASNPRGFGSGKSATPKSGEGDLDIGIS